MKKTLAVAAVLLALMGRPATADFTINGPITFSGDFSKPGGTVSLTCGSTGVGITNCVQTWGKAQRGNQGSVALSTSTFTMDLNAVQHFSLTLDHAACPCVIANPSNLASAEGQLGIITITQSASGNDGVTWGSVFKFAGGNTPILSVGPNAIDYLSYYVQDATHVIISLGVLNAQ